MRRLWIGALAILALAGAAAADRLHPSTSPAPAADAPAEPGGVWVCPVVKVAGANGFIHLVNTGDERSSVRVMYIPDGRKPLEQAITIPPRHAATLGTPGAIKAQGAGAVIDYAGGNLTASRTVRLLGSYAGAASCTRPGGVRMIVPQGTTFQADTQLTLLNPGTADAVVDISLLVNGDELAPVSLQGRVVPAHKRLVVREGDFAFDARAVAAVVTATTGRVATDAILVTRAAVDLIPGVSTSRELLTLASTARGGAGFTTVAIGDQDAVVQAHVLSGAGQSVYGPLTTGLAPNTPQRAAPPSEGVPAGAVALSAVSKTSPIAIGSRWLVAASGGRADSAFSSGVQPSHQVIAVIGPPAVIGGLRLLIANPDATDSIFGVTIITEAGATKPPRLQGNHLEPGRTSTVTFTGLTPNATVGVIITSAGARIGATLEAITVSATSYGAYAVSGVPVSTVPVVAVEPDARQGVPAS